MIVILNHLELVAIIQAIAAAISPKGLSIREVKKIVAKALGIQRVYDSRLDPIIAEGEEAGLFTRVGNKLVRPKTDCGIPGFERMSADAQQYYRKAIKTHSTYQGQCEQYIEYCRKTGNDAVHPAKWVVGDE